MKNKGYKKEIISGYHSELSFANPYKILIN